MNPAHQFLDAQQHHKEHPDTFHIADDEAIQALRIGDSVKVCHNGERFWVIITAITPALISGEIANVLINDQPFDCDDIISFERRHILNTETKEEYEAAVEEWRKTLTPP